MPLSQAEWAMVAYYCWMGAEQFSETARSKISNESLIGILQAFLAVYELRKAKKTREDEYYLTNLPTDAQVERKDPREVGREDVCRTVSQTIQSLKKNDQGQAKAIQAVKNPQAG